MQIGNKAASAISETEVVPTELPSLKATILKPKFLLIALAFSLVMNLLLLIAALSGTNNDTVTPGVPAPTKVSGSITPSLTSRPTARPSDTPGEAEIRLKDCFANCNTEDLITMIREEALKISNIKASIELSMEIERNCYGIYMQSTSPDKQYNSYHSLKCPGKVSTPPQDTIHIADNLYTLNSSGNWDIGSKPRIGQTKLIDVIDILKEQQEKSLLDANPDDGYKKIVTTSKIINDLSQQVTRSATITVNEFLEVTSYQIDIEKVSSEKGRFFDANIQNTISEPL